MIQCLDDLNFSGSKYFLLKLAKYKFTDTENNLITIDCTVPRTVDENMMMLICNDKAEMNCTIQQTKRLQNLNFSFKEQAMAMVTSVFLYGN